MHNPASLWSPVLKSEGFKKRRGSWMRRSGNFVDAIEFQISKSEEQLTINIGILHIDVYDFIWKNDPMWQGALEKDDIDPSSCAINLRIGELYKQRRDVWWRLDDLNIGEIFAEDLRYKAIPFVEKMHNRADAIAWLIEKKAPSYPYPYPALSLSVLLALDGRKAEGCEILRNVSKNSKSRGWASLASDLAVRMDCAECRNYGDSAQN